MFIIKGFKKIEEDVLTVENKELCMNCCNYTNYKIVKRSEHFTLFFIPIFPTSIKYSLECPLCTYKIRLKHYDIGKYRINQ